MKNKLILTFVKLHWGVKYNKKLKEKKNQLIYLADI